MKPALLSPFSLMGTDLEQVFIAFSGANIEGMDVLFNWEHYCPDLGDLIGGLITFFCSQV